MHIWTQAYTEDPHNLQLPVQMALCLYEPASVRLPLAYFKCPVFQLLLARILTLTKKTSPFWLWLKAYNLCCFDNKHHKLLHLFTWQMFFIQIALPLRTSRMQEEQHDGVAGGVHGSRVPQYDPGFGARCAMCSSPVSVWVFPVDCLLRIAPKWEVERDLVCVGPWDRLASHSGYIPSLCPVLLG